MAQKISWTELRRTIATRAGVSEKNAGAFLNSLNAQIIAALRTERQVKINGLGTFKLQAVAPRKSVNVTTGEEMTIPGYNKVVFAPEAGVKELVEKNAVVDAPVVAPKKSKEAAAAVPAVTDPLEKLGAQAAEIVDILGELGQAPKEETKAEEKKAKAAAKPKKAAKKKEEPVVAQATAVIEPEKPVVEPEIPEKPKVEPETAPVVEPKTPEVPESPVEAPQEEPKEEPVVEPAPTVERPRKEIVIQMVEPVAEPVAATPEPTPFVVPDSAAEPETPVEEPKKKKHHFWRDTLICVIILLILAGVAYYFFRQEIRTYIKEFIEKNKTEQVKENDKQTTDDGTTASFEGENGDVTSKGEFAAQENAGEQEIAEEAVTEIPANEMIVIEEQTYKKLLKTEAITEGSRLAWIAKKYYGAKIYWPYLYDANKDHLSNPNLIVVGTPIRVPKLTALQKDTMNAQTMATIEHLRLEAEAKMR